MKIRLLFFIGLTLVLVPSAAAEEEVSSPYVGKEVRVHVVESTAGGWDSIFIYQGELVTWDDAGMHIVDREGVSTTVSPGDLDRMQVRSEYNDKTGQGALYGVLAGVVFGGLIGAATAPGDGAFIGWSAPEGAAAGALLLGAVGLVVGMIVGAASSGGDWTEVDLATLRPRVSWWMEPGGGGGLVLTTRF